MPVVTAQVCVLTTSNAAGHAFAEFTRLPLPGNLTGMLLLPSLLGCGIVSLGWIDSGAAGFVIVTGMIGTMIGPWLLTRAGIDSHIARGLALGSISHGQGTAQALDEGSLQGAIAGTAMGVSAKASQ